jgi:hypothetical protein
VAAAAEVGATLGQKLKAMAGPELLAQFAG